MKPSYLCPYHAQLIKRHENSAISYWCEMMHCGTQAYAQCRIEAAELYLGAATEVALVRRACTGNIFFNDLHIAKPLELIMELHAQDFNFTKAPLLLSKVSLAVFQGNKKPHRVLMDLLHRDYESAQARTCH